MGSPHVPAHLEPGEDVHQALLGHSVHDTLAVLQHGLELRVPAPVRGVEAEGADHVGDGPCELGGHVQGRVLRSAERLAQGRSLPADWGGGERQARGDGGAEGVEGGGSPTHPGCAACREHPPAQRAGMGRRDDAGCWGGAEGTETCREVSVCGSMLLLAGARSPGEQELAPCLSLPGCE